MGKILSHDITKIVKDEFKGPAFKKGHIIQTQDIEEFLKLGKEHVYVLELEGGEIHEDEAGSRLARAAAGAGVRCSQPKESRVNLFAECAGLLKINLDALDAINDLPDVILSTLPNHSVVKEGDMLAGTKVIPLVIKEEILAQAERIINKAGNILQVVPFLEKKVGLIVTGSEVYKGRITDTFGPVLSEKMASYGATVIELAYAPDDAQVIAEKINHAIEKGADIILVSGGMSVDPDDVTPLGIRNSGAEIIKYGAPALPGAMFLMAYKGDVAVLGIPACGMYFRTTVLDLVLPRLLAGDRISRRDIVKLAHGGLCRACSPCHYPNCTFGIGDSWN
ncbi:molybdenum cofactor cytidylyltransferase [Desulforamulus reducens MI-1]|uniref:Molybdopterin molybdenumtransferase n=1 Tax=Desulforamulus reducens (strain ATCC BAA-1160 / DSM 100696 / MI-1) TaxID=349161 RepID=A4J865_DESRM|nr:molybdopterin-binding protein [Desulforamulus reducens]ABO51268.1 molybdenum cofactor cytidylyltransferase [Desulforamulus reducens MI-1]